MRRAFNIVEVVIVLAVLLILAAILFPIFARNPDRTAPRSACQSNLKQIGLGIMQYCQDYNETFPSNRGNVNGTFGWADGIHPYTKSVQLHQCPSEPTKDVVEKPRSVGYTDYWMNNRVFGVSMEKVENFASTIMLGDGNDGSDATDARYAIDTLPAAWLNDEKSPAYRHVDGANYCFADGHAKWYKPEQIKQALPGPTFAIR